VRASLVILAIVPTALGAGAWPAGGASPDASASPATLTAPAFLPAVSLAGPFGRLDGLPIAADAALPDPAWLRTLDAYGRGATIRAAPRDENLVFLDWRLTAVQDPADELAEAIELGGVPDSGMDLAPVDAPPTGVWMIRLDASLAQRDVSFDNVYATGSWVWRVVVPDRDVPGDDETYPPVPGILLSSGQNMVEMELGSGCFITTCGDVGGITPDRLLPGLVVAGGAPMVISLADGSGLAGWHVLVRPVGRSNDAFELISQDSLGVSRPVAVIAPPGRGNWVTEAKVDFDLERGTYYAYARVRVR
jgi:hypothetical protein